MCSSDLLLLDHIGWRSTWVVMAVVFMALSIPLSAIFLRRQPEDMGLELDGGPPTPGRGRAPGQAALPVAEETSWTVR